MIRENGWIKTSLRRMKLVQFLYRGAAENGFPGMTERETAWPRHPHGWLAAACFLFVLYFLGSLELDVFQIRDPHYILNNCGRDNWHSLAGSILRYFDPAQVSSMLWKIFFLFPGLCCASVWVAACISEDSAKKIAGLGAWLCGKRGAVLSLAIAATAIILLIVFVFQGKPTLDDEYAYLFQAKTYLTGHVALPPPPVPKAFRNMQMIMSNVWTGKYLFGQPLLLTPGVLVGSAHIVTVAMALASLTLIFFIGLKTGTRAEASLAAALVSVSPFFWFTSSTLYSQISMLFCVTLFILGWLHLMETRNPLLALAIGFCWGWSFTVRPLTAVFFAIPFAFLMLRNVCRQPREWVLSVLALVIGGGVVIAIVMWYNYQITGSPWVLPFSYYWPQERIGFGYLFPVGEPTKPYYHSVAKALVNFAVTLLRTNSWYLGWPVSLLPLLGLLTIRIAARPEREPGSNIGDSSLTWNSNDSLWLSIIVIFCVGYSVYFSPGVSDTGPVYYYELLVPLSLLSAKGIIAAHTVLSRTKQAMLRKLVPSFCILSCLGSVLLFVPEKALHIRTLTDMAFYPFSLAERRISDRAVVFVGPTPPVGWLLNPPLPSPSLDDRILYVRLSDAATNREVLKAFPDRSPYVLYYEGTAGEFMIRHFEEGG